VVSNQDVRQIILSPCFLLLTVCSWAQSPSARKTEQAAIQSAKKLLVSSLDSSLPKVSLEFFLKYEAPGVPIK